MRAAFTCLCAWLVTLSSVAVSHAATPAPFTATYVASYRDIEGGTLTLSFQAAEQTGHFSIETHVDPGFLAQFFVSKNAVERSEFLIDAQGVRPLHWRVEDGKSSIKGDGEAVFDWEHLTVKGKDGDKPIDLPLERGMQDRMSIQIAVMDALINGREPGTIKLIDGNRAKDYVYTRLGTASLDTAVGKLDTVIYESKRPNSSDRVSKFWYAPSLGYLTVRAEQSRKGKTETVLVVKEIK